MAKKVLVILGTSRQGRAVVEALVAAGSYYDVYATTRSGTNAALEAKGVTCLPFAFDAASAKAALDAADPALVFFTTLMGTREGEAGQGKLVVDAIKAKGSVEHVVYSSVAGCDLAPDAVSHFKSKLDVEEHLQASGLSFSILRPVAFFENYDDPANYNALTKGSCKTLWPGTLKVPHVACRDIGRAAAVMLADPAAWKGKTLDCAACDVTGEEVAAALTAASGVPCTYSTAMPRWLLGCLLKDLAAMVEFFETEPFTSTESQIAAFKKVVPDALDAQGFFEAKGQWADGTKFE
eukprot:CAMPEP_0119283494 /NCGR_PEP_ID=MMETSP1329-20130426/28597_1 /TAXON_ID=114041 /ORGANISM="Genus nov. species nov., Strain RCC1024" /LENGTH=293 /DNA_ID=CAMNT_0007284167 /DNA_START=36 /DNA_END=914 /DNA_ORIENTATION=-